MKRLKDIYDTICEWMDEAILGFGTSVTFSLIWTELVHVLAVIIGGVLSTIAIHYVNKLLKKYDK